MKTFTLIAAVAAVCVAQLAQAENILIATADAASNSSDPMFIPGVGTPEGLDGSDDGSAAGANEDVEAPAMVKAAGGSMDGSMDHVMTKPAPTGSNTSTPTPSSTKSAAAPSALVGTGVAVAAVSVFSVALL